ncbi:MAG TPA: sulfide/dihydroorotate dehydrogenase-like FAD/NAD-binding protein [Candidatus Bathyarchaeota archaeon]|nr:MAG: sulfide/dihydroorotate dehydrogenase-like FAD/NAD-binding protein [Candidatus Verstraetearchaeota archaeon]HDO20647.1 sulfide/dihydroorotate dehydrogenase-like FAD/NAD-binding protein [Candidatus Bathyarchaeota archaeon]
MCRKFEILEKRTLAPKIKEIVLYAPEIARKVRAGQFIIVRVEEKGERIPLTVADWNRNKGTLTIVFQEIGVSTYKLGKLDIGDRLTDIAGPLGNPSKIENYGRVICIGGGVGIAAIYPIARELKKMNNYVISIIGARSRELLIYEDEMRKVSDELKITTDDGSKGRKGFVSDELRDMLAKGVKVDRVIAVGPAIMMKVCADVTRPYGIKTIASLNPIMVCGMGMCAACRVEVGGKTRFVCFEGPEFDAHEVNFTELMKRLNAYREEEKIALEKYLKKIGEVKPNAN